MKQTYSLTLLATILFTTFCVAQNVVITGYLDSPCPNQNGRTLEIYVDGSVDFTGWTVVRQSNGGGFDPGSATVDISGLGTVSNAFAYVTNSPATLDTEFNITTNILESGSINGNGDDGFQLVDATSNLIDRFGVDGQDASGESWDHLDSYAYRKNGTTPNAGSFDANNWLFGGINLLDGEGTCNGAQALSNLVPFGSYTATASTDPTLFVSGTLNGFEYFENNGPSIAQTFSTSGSNLTSDISLIADTNFEISFSESTGYASTLSITPTNGEIASTTIYARLVAGLNAGNYNGNISIGTTGAETQLIEVTGEVTADDPFITLAGNVDGLSYNEGSGPSGVDTFGVSGMFLSTDITISVTNEFELSLEEMGTYASSISLSPTDGTVENTTIYIRLKAGETVGSYTGTITASSTGAPDETLSASGTVNTVATCAAVGSIIITEVMQNPGAVSDNVGEYFELYNTTDSDINIQSWIIKDDSSASEMFTITSSVIVPANGYVVLGLNADTNINGGYTADFVYSGLTLSNSGTDGLIVECSGTDIDEVIWDASWPFSPGTSMELTTASLNSVANDDVANWTAATTSYGSGDLGTPGAPNGATASNQTQSVLQFSMYPNPATSGTLNISVTNGGSVDVEIFSTLGQRVVNQKAVTTSVNINGLNTGLYIVKLTQGEASQTRKLVVK